MIYQINGEQPFQVLSDSFSVSPSESGYNLYLSADGVNYSQFATVAANTTRQFTGMNNGNYYILSGNTSDVQVNWNRDCRGGGGGAAGVSSLDGQTGALTTKTIGGQSILGEGDIPVGGGDGDYYIDGDNINSYSGVVNEIYHKIASGETVYVASKYDYVRYPVAKAEIYEYQEGQPGDPDYLRQEGFQIVATRFGNDGFAIRSGVLRAFRYEGRDGDGYTCGTSWDYTMSEENGGNYQIVGNISEVQNPQAGTKVYVRSGSTVDTYDGIAFDASTVSEGYVAKVFDGQGNQYFGIYRSGDNFFWNWENDGDIHKRTSLDKLFYYKSDTTNHIFYLFPADTATTLDFQEMGEGVTTASTSTSITVTWEAQSLMYTGSEYVSTSDVIYDLDNMTQSEIAALNAYLNSASEIERVGAHIYKDRNKCRYDNIENSKVRFECHYISNGTGFAFIKNYIFYIKTDGTFEYIDNGSEYGIPATFEVNYATHTLTSTNTPIWAAARGINKGVIPVVYLLSGSTGVAIAKDAYIEKTGDLSGIIGATFEYSGETINAKWSYDQNTATLISWSTGGSKKSFKFNEMTQAELADMYAELTALPSATTNYNELYDFYNFADWNGGGHYRGWKMQGGYPDSQGRLAFSAVTIKESDLSQIYFFQTFISNNGTIDNRFTEYHLGS